MSTANTGDSFCYETLTDPSEIASIGDDWDRLLNGSRANRAFNCSKWFLAAIALYPELSPLVLIARRGATLSGVFPLVVDSREGTARFQGAWSAYPDILADADDCEISRGLLNYALSSKRSYEKLLLRRIRPDSNCIRAARALGLIGEDDPPFLPRSIEACYYASLEQGYEHYMNTRSRNLRHNMTRVQNKASREGVAATELTPGEIDPSTLPELFMSLHFSRFGEQTVLRSSRMFLETLLPALFVERRMRAFALVFNDKTVGIHLAMVGANSLIGWNAGFTDEIASLSPGRLLLHAAIRQACADGLAEYDLREGSESYKSDWRTHTRNIGSLELAIGGRRLIVGSGSLFKAEVTR